MLITNTGKVLKEHSHKIIYSQWQAIPLGLRPDELEISKRRVQYRWMEGRHPWSTSEIDSCYSNMIRIYWKPTDSIHLADSHSYASYCSVHPPGQYPWTLVENVHGDLTLENMMLVRDRGLVLIDPGHPRNMRCRENDEAKMLQSIITQWEFFTEKFDDPVCSIPPFETTYAHCWLLWTHWKRLYRHRPSLYASYVIQRLALEFQNENDLRSRWSTDRLQEECISCIQKSIRRKP